MGRTGPKILEDFVIPNLNKKSFGKKLRWENSAEGIFLVQWLHKSGPNWNEEENEVFTEWDKMKNRTLSGKSSAFTHSKQRFRSALLKKSKDNKGLRELPCPDKQCKRYQIIPVCYDQQVANDYPTSSSSSDLEASSDNDPYINQGMNDAMDNDLGHRNVEIQRQNERSSKTILDVNANQENFVAEIWGKYIEWPRVENTSIQDENVICTVVNMQPLHKNEVPNENSFENQKNIIENNSEMEWDKMKNRTLSGKSLAFTHSKQKFASKDKKGLRELLSPGKYYKRYQILPVCHDQQVANDYPTSPSSSDLEASSDNDPYFNQGMNDTMDNDLGQPNVEILRQNDLYSEIIQDVNVNQENFLAEIGGKYVEWPSAENISIHDENVICTVVNMQPLLENEVPNENSFENQQSIIANDSEMDLLANDDFDSHEMQVIEDLIQNGGYCHPKF